MLCERERENERESEREREREREYSEQTCFQSFKNGFVQSAQVLRTERTDTHTHTQTHTKRDVWFALCPVCVHLCHTVTVSEIPEICPEIHFGAAVPLVC